MRTIIFTAALLAATFAVTGAVPVAQNGTPTREHRSFS